MSHDDKPHDNTAHGRFFGLPGSDMGWWSVALGLAFFAFLAVFYMAIGAGLGELHRPGSGRLAGGGGRLNSGHSALSHALLVLLLVTAAVSAVAGGATGLVAILKKRERSVLLFLALLLGGLVLFMAVAEAMGY
jgi:hypothetical protein